jgi:hypothetical protein
MGARGIILATIAIGAACTLYAILKASDDIADQFSDWDAPEPTPALKSLMQSNPAGSHPFVPATNSPGQSRIAGDFSFWLGHTNTDPGTPIKQTVAAASRPILRASVNEAPGFGHMVTASKVGNATIHSANLYEERLHGHG